jgi:hypothetical protein
MKRIQRLLHLKKIARKEAIGGCKEPKEANNEKRKRGSYRKFTAEGQC